MILAIAKCALNISWPKLPKVASNIDIIRAFPDFPKHMHHMPWSLDSSGKSEHINIINFIIAKTESGSLLILFIYTLFIFCVNIVRFGNDLRLTPQHDHSSNSILGQWNGLEPPARWAGATMQQLCRNGTGYACSIGGIYFWLFLVSWWCNVWVLNISHCFEHKTSEPCQCRRFDWNRFVSKWRLIGKCHDQGADGNPYADTSISIWSTL